MLNALLWSLTCSAQHNRHIQWSFNGQPYVTCADSLSLPHPMTIARYKITQHVPERQRPMSVRSAQQLVSCFGRIYSHLEVLTQGNRNVFINTPNADIVTCIIICEYTARCVHIELCRYFIYSATWRIYSSPFLFGLFVIGHPDYMAIFSLQYSVF